MLLIDSHTHIYGEEFNEDRDAMLQRATEAGVGQMVLPNVDIESYPRLLELCTAYPQRLFPTIGLHPTYVKEDYDTQLRAMEGELTERTHVAIGEIGLDYYWDTTYQKEQIDAFKRQLHWAAQHDLPVILHIREAFADAFSVLREVNLPQLRGVFHSFTGTEEELREALSFEHFYIGINGVVTFKNDAPYLAPVPKRGKRNEPSFLPHTASFVASCYQLTDDALIAKTSENARRLFALPEY